MEQLSDEGIFPFVSDPECEAEAGRGAFGSQTLRHSVALFQYAT